MAPKTISAADLDDEKNIKVNLAHLFAKLKVVVTVNGVPYNPIKSLVIGGTKTQAHFTPETGELSEATNEATITAYIEDEETSTYTYECILLPQTVEANTLTVTAYLDEDRKQEKTYTHPSTLTLQGNTQYTLSLSMDHEGKFTPSSSVSVGGWDNEDIEGGELEEGAITSKDDEGKITYTVSTARGLLEWAKAVQEDNDINLILTEDIDMKGKTWPAIDGCNYVTIDGGGHTISNLTLTEGETGETGLIGNICYRCNIKDLTLLNPSITKELYVGVFIGDFASDCTMENCHVIGGTFDDRKYPVGLVSTADGSSFIACSVTSSNMNLISRTVNNNNITACYVTGGKLVDEEIGGTPTYTASYYQESADGSITAAGNESTPVTDWGEAATQMNTALSGKNYEWVENPDKEDTDRPLVIQYKTTD